MSPTGDLVEIVELKDHPWFVACQFHPEFQSTPLEAHPLFREFIRASLARQAASPVRWVETIQRMAADGVTHVVECGPGRILAGLTKRIAPTLESIAIADAAGLEDALARLTP